MSRNTINVTVRIRPSSEKNEKDKEIKSTLEVVEDKEIHFDCDTARRKLGSIGMRRRKNQSYAFDHVFPPNSSTREVYEKTARASVLDAMDGFNATVFAYGATGSGKTHTMIGNSEGGPGIIVQAMFDVFNQISTNTDLSYDLSVSYFEIYNEKIRDLLVPQNHQNLPLRFSKEGGAVVVGLTVARPSSGEEVSKLLAEGNLRRSQSVTDKNAESSRSHAIFQVVIKSKGMSNLTKVKSGKLSLIDLAGSERASSSRNRGHLLVEGANINRSLLALGNCINALSKNSKPAHVPFRDSTLTRLLSDSLCGNCRTVMIVTVSGSLRCIEDTANTLKYANNAKRIQVKSFRNEDKSIKSFTQSLRIVENLKKQVLELQKRLCLYEENGEGVQKVDEKETRELSDFAKFEEKMEENAKTLEDTQIDLWRLRRVKSAFEIEGRLVKTQLEYWIRRKDKLNLPQTPKVVRRLKRLSHYADDKTRSAEKKLMIEKEKTENIKRKLFQDESPCINSLFSSTSKKTQQLVQNLQNKLARLREREKKFSNSLVDQETEILRLRESEASARLHIVALLEVCSFQHALLWSQSPCLSPNEKRECEIAFDNVLDIAKMYDIQEFNNEQERALLHNLDTMKKNVNLFTPKKFASTSKIQRISPLNVLINSPKEKRVKFTLPSSSETSQLKKPTNSTKPTPSSFNIRRGILKNSIDSLSSDQKQNTKTRFVFSGRKPSRSINANTGSVKNENLEKKLEIENKIETNKDKNKSDFKECNRAKRKSQSFAEKFYKTLNNLPFGISKRKDNINQNKKKKKQLENDFSKSRNLNLDPLRIRFHKKKLNFSTPLRKQK